MKAPHTLVISLVLAVASSACGDEPGDTREGPALPPRPAAQTCMADPAAPFPTLLSATGCFSEMAELTPGPDLVPYDLNAPLWTEGADKYRYLVVPPGTQLVERRDGGWTFPVGSVLVKVFAFGRRRIETRLMLLRDDGWDFAEYRFRDDGLEADLLSESLLVPMVVDGTALEYFFPDEQSCRECHSRLSGVEVLGPRTAQLNRLYDYDGFTQNQLVAMRDNGLFANLDGPVSALDAWPDPSVRGGTLAGRARAYLHGNCAHCHRPDGFAPAGLDLDLRYDTRFVDTGTCDEPVMYGDLMHLSRIRPGHERDSGLYRRMVAEGLDRMPPVGATIADPAGEELVRRWIRSIPACP